MLRGLWTALGMTEDAPERQLASKLLAAERPSRLHRRNLDKAMAEVQRLEGCKAQVRTRLP
jgi:protein regulator of cytokinesis 1